MTWFWMWLGCGAEPAVEVPPPDLSGRVAWVEARAADRIPFATLPAQVVSGAAGRIEVGPGVTGRLVSWEVRPGDPVRAGDPLARLISPELGELDTRITEASTRVEERARIVEDRRRAEARGVVSRSELHEAEADLAEARAAWTALRAQSEALRDTIVREGGGLVWRAPVDARVAELLCPVGSFQADQACLALVDEAGGLLEVRVPERHLGALVGRVSATFTGADGHEAAFVEVSRSPDVDPRTRSLRIWMGAEGAPLRVGASGRARLEAAAPDDAVEVPASALARDGTSTVVFVREGDELQPVVVRVLGRSGDGVVLTGPLVGSEVVTKGVFLVQSLAALEEAP